MTPEAVVFDIGNVLIEWNPERFYDRAIGEARRRALFAAVDLHGMNARVDAGGDLAQEARALAAQHPEFADQIVLWHTSWLDMASPEIPSSVRSLRALRAAGVPVFALSNFGRAPFAIAKAAYPFLDEFDRRFLSCEHGLMKPDAAFYALLEQTTGVPPDRLLFTDDRAENIAAAAARGWQVHHFGGPAAWCAALVRLGLLTAGEAAA